MNWFEKQFLKLLWGRLEAKMPILKRYLPLLGVAGLVASTVLRYFGLSEAAAIVDSAGGLTGATQASPVSAVELGAAVAAGAGVVLKVVSEIRKLGTA